MLKDLTGRWTPKPRRPKLTDGPWFYFSLAGTIFILIEVLFVATGRAAPFLRAFTAGVIIPAYVFTNVTMVCKYFGHGWKMVGFVMLVLAGILLLSLVGGGFFAAR